MARSCGSTSFCRPGRAVPGDPGAHPYGKDNLPRRRGRGCWLSIQYRMLRQPSRVRFSAWTGWEAPDPAWWVAQGYAVVNCDLRGAGTSDGEATCCPTRRARTSTT